MLSCYEEGFRMADALSECSMKSKARIDALFEDTRSFCSSTLGGWCATTLNAHCPDSNEIGMEEQIKANGAVHARIEAMFASVEAESGTLGKSAAAVLPVKYMGAAPVGGRVASVRGLQEPLRQLLEQIDHSISAELEISRQGLTFRTPEISEKTNPFRRIAVWSALKLRSKVSSPKEVSHAFIPLVSDDQMPVGYDERHADLYRTMKGLPSDTKDYPPIFAVVMRRPGAARLLECHAFACRTEEDAVAAAATLYRALLADLDVNRRRPRQTNGLGCVSLASVASSVVEPSSLGTRSIFGDRTQYPRLASFSSPGMPRQPIRPPRSKKNSGVSGQNDRVSVRSIKMEKTSKKKKVSEIKAEDVLEARSRKLPPANSRLFTPEESTKNVASAGGCSVVAGNENNRDALNAGISNGDHESRKNGSANEKLGNFRNQAQINKEVPKITEARDKPHDDKDALSREQRVYDNFVKSARIGKTLDQRNNPEVNYSFVKKNCSIIGETIANDVIGECSERNETFYEINGQNDKNHPESRCYSRKDSRSNEETRASSTGRDNPFYERLEVIDKRNSRDKMYAKHFKDVNKICSFGEEDFPITGPTVKSTSSRSRTTTEDNFSLSRPGKWSWDRSKKTNDEMKIQTPNTQKHRARVSRIDTMDSGGNQGKNGLSMEMESDGTPNVRTRTRAGSEPPFGKTEGAMKNYREESRLKRSQSDLESERGDPMTRVELPRRGSFLKPTPKRLPNEINGGTPLGFTELFDEFRNQEGLTSVDDILAAIIDPEGMSFNDLKPLYKEFLLKLAATLTQDELYERSASIMRRRRPQRRRSTRKSCLLSRAIRRSVSRLKNGPTEFTSVIFPARKLNDSFDSSSSCDAKNNRKRVLASRLSRRRSSWRNTKSAFPHTTSEDSDTCRRATRGGGVGANRSSSGYVTCSECSYDSESCTCVSADKCYCSLSRKVQTELAVPNNAVVCGCDTDSCSDSNKCYCARRSSQPTILEQLRQRGIIPSESTLSRAKSPGRTAASRIKGDPAAANSSEYVKIHPSPVRSGSENFALDYDLFSPGKKSQPSSAGREKVLVISARDPQGRLVYVGGAEREKKSFENGTNRTEAHHEALSIKKSAEIAAIFGPGSTRARQRAESISSVRSSVSLEAGLGYLP